MKFNKKFSVAVAAILLGSQLASTAAAALTHSDLDRIEIIVQSGDVQAMLEFLELHPELLQIKGALGAAIKAFLANPNDGSLARILQRANGDLSVALERAAERSGISIY